MAPPISPQPRKKLLRNPLTLGLGKAISIVKNNAPALLQSA